MTDDEFERWVSIWVRMPVVKSTPANPFPFASWLGVSVDELKNLDERRETRRRDGERLAALAPAEGPQAGQGEEEKGSELRALRS